MKISYLGPPGTFCHQAALKWAEEGSVLVPADTIDSAAKMVEAGEAKQCAIPIENSLEGSVPDTLRVISDAKGLIAAGEVLLPIVHCLLSQKGTTLEQIKKIYSHPHAFGQCRDFLSLLPHIALLPVNSTAAAASLVSDGSGSEAAIAPLQAGELYNLEALRIHIEDRDDSVTRFIVLDTREALPTGNDKCSLIVSVEHRPGALYQLLGIFSEYQINILRIESRPARRALGEYIFFIDLEGHIKNRKIAAALRKVNAFAAYFRHLGSYPVFRN